MATDVYVAIDVDGNVAVSDPVPGGGGATYSAVFASVDACFSDPTYGYHDISAATGTDERMIYEFYKPAVQTPYVTNNGIVLTAANYSSTATNYPILKPAEGHYHGGIWNDAVQIQRDLTTTHNILTLEMEDKSVAYGLAFESLNGGTNLNTTTGTVLIENKSLVIACLGKAARHCFINRSGWLDNPPLSDKGKYISCVSWGTTTGDGFHAINFSRAFVFYNCVALNSTRYGFHAETSTHLNIAHNLMALNSGIADFAPNIGASVVAPGHELESFASGDGSAATTATVCNNPLTSVPFTTVEDYANGDAHLTAAGKLLLEGAGYDNIADLDTVGYNRDIDWQPYSLPTIIGADKPGTFTVPVTLTALNAEDLTPIPGASLYVTAEAGGPLPVDTEIGTGITDALGVALIEPEFTAVQPFKVSGRKASLSPFFQEGIIVGEILAEGYTGNVYMITDEG